MTNIKKVGSKQDSAVLNEYIKGCERGRNEENIGSVERREHNELTWNEEV